MRELFGRVGLGAWIAAVWFLGGRRLLPRRLRDEEPLLVWASALGLGAGTTAFVVTLLAVVGWLRPAQLWLLLAAWTIPAVLEGRSLLLLAKPRFRGATTAWTLLLTAALAATLVFSLIGALAPPSSIDALVYHLRIPHEYLRSGRMVALTDDPRAFQPFNVEMLFAFGMGLRDDVLPALLHWLLGIGAALTSGAWARRLGAKSPLVAITVFAVSPLCVWESTSPFIDLALTLFSSLAFLWATRSDLGRSGVVLAAVFAGLAAGSKFTGCTIAALVGGVAFLHALPDRRRASVGLLTVSVLAVAIASPWYLRNALWTGNPFFPLGNRLFGMPPSAQLLSNYVYGYGHDLLHFFTSPFDLLWRGDPFDLGWSVGPSYLALVPIAFLHRWRERTFQVLAVVLALSWIVWFYSSPQTRLLLPILPLAAGMVAVALDRLDADGQTRLAARAAIGLSIAVGLATSAVVVKGSWKVVAGIETRDGYLRRTAFDYTAFEQMNPLLGADSRLAVYGVPNVYYLRPRATIVSREEIPDLAARGFTHLVWIGDCVEKEPQGDVIWRGRYGRPGSRFQGIGSWPDACGELIRLNGETGTRRLR